MARRINLEIPLSPRRPSSHAHPRRLSPTHIASHPPGLPGRGSLGCRRALPGNRTPRHGRGVQAGEKAGPRPGRKGRGAIFETRKARTRASTFRETKRVFDREILPAWRGRRLSEITKADVRKLIEGVAKRAPVGANRLLASLKTFLAFAVEQDLISVSPAASVRPPAVEKARERTLDDSELSAVWNASLGLQGYGAGIRLLLLTGARRSEVFGMTADEIDSAKAVWNLPARRAKNNRAHAVPLSPQATDVLRWICPAFEKGNFALFEPVSFSREKGLLDKLLPNVAAFTLHDLRRTFASGMASLGVAPHVLESCLNHKSGQVRGVAAIYNRYQYEPEKRAALFLWGGHVAALVAVPALEAAA